MATTSERLTRPNIAQLDRLIIACHDGARAQTAAARLTTGVRSDRLHALAARRLSFADELAAVIRSSGGKPKHRGSAFETFRAAMHDVNALVIGDHTGDAYASCARIEAKAEKLYERDDSAGMPSAATAIIARQQLEIAADSAELRRMSMGG